MRKNSTEFINFKRFMKKMENQKKKDEMARKNRASERKKNNRKPQKS